MDFLAELNLLSTGVSAWGDIMAGSAERKAYDMNASMVEFAGEQTQEDITKQEKELTSTQRAMFAKAGVTQSGSPLEVILQAASSLKASLKPGSSLSLLKTVLVLVA